MEIIVIILHIIVGISSVALGLKLHKMGDIAKWEYEQRNKGESDNGR